MSLSISVCVVNWNTRGHLERCLDSLPGALLGVNGEVIVVDNASSDGSAEMVRQRFPEVHLHALDVNLGFAGGNNLAIEQSRGEFVLLLNPDIYAPEGSITALVEYLRANPSVAAAGAALVGDDGRVQTPFYRRVPSLTQVVLYYAGFSYLTAPFKSLQHRVLDFDVRGEAPIDVEQLPGACCMVRRSVIDEVGMLDPDYFIWFEDVDWCYRIRQRGGRLQVLPGVRMLHAGGASFRGWSKDKQVRQFFLAFFRFLSKFRQDDLMESSLRVLSADMALKSVVLRGLRRLPFGARFDLPAPETLASVRRELALIAERHRAGELVRLSADGYSFESAPPPR